jgi:hypothetical protein
MRKETTIMSDIVRYSNNSPILAGSQFRGKDRAASKAIARADSNAVVVAHEMANDAALADFRNELEAQLERNEAQRRLRQAHDVVHGVSQLRNVAAALAHGDPSREMDLNDITDAYKIGEMRRMMSL